MPIVILTHFHTPSHFLVLDVNMAFTMKAAFSLNKQFDRIPRENSVGRTGRDVQTNVYKSKIHLLKAHNAKMHNTKINKGKIYKSQNGINNLSKTRGTLRNDNPP